MADLDHDTLIEIRNDVRHLIENFHQQNNENTVRFSRVEKDLVWHNKLLYGALGIIAFMEFLTKAMTK